MNYRLILATTALFGGLTAAGALALPGHLAPRGGSVGQALADPANTCKAIMVSDKSGGYDPVYTTTSPYGPYPGFPTMPAVDNGWGLYATNSIIYAGQAPNSINVAKPCQSYIGYTYTTFGYGAPLSIAADYNYNIYATEYGSSTIDWISTGDTATTDTARFPGLPYYLAVDNVGNVFISGWDPTNTVEQIDKCGPGVVGCIVCETIPAPSWPGGVALDANQHLIVNNEIGSISVFNAGCGTQTSTYTYSAATAPRHFHFTAITLNRNETLIVGAKQFDKPAPGCNPAFCMDAQAEHYNNVTGTAGTIAGATHTPIIPGGQPGGGIAVYPPGPV